MQFLNEAGERWYEIPDGNADIAVFKKQDEIHIIASLLDFDNAGKTEEITLKIETDKPASVTLNRINDTYANPLALWEKAGKPQVPTKEQLRELQENAGPSEEQAAYAYSDGFVTLTLSLASNEVQRIIIR